MTDRDAQTNVVSNPPVAPGSVPGHYPEPVTEGPTILVPGHEPTNVPFAPPHEPAPFPETPVLPPAPQPAHAPVMPPAAPTPTTETLPTDGGVQGP